jgi:glycosyltransferase 2 family protein
MDLPHPSTSLKAIASFRPRAKRVYYYVWLLLKNLIGWALILASGPIGLTFPGPGGLPLFLIGFAMITFPGKRSLTSSVMRGKPINANSSRAIGWSIVAAVLLPAVTVMVFSIRFYDQMQRHGPALVFTVYGIAVVAAWMLISLGIRAMNYGLTFAPAIRRKVRPWMRRRGIVLLPPRRRRRLQRLHDGGSSVSSGDADQDEDTGILEVDDRYQNSIKSFWTTARPWLKRGLGFVLTAAIFGWMIHKIFLHWADVKDRASSISIANFALAAVMFAIFLFVFRAMSWRRIIKGFGHVIPIAPATRIWSTSELTRYVPIAGVIGQVAGRVYLVRPYGVSGTECAASQVLELVIFLLANVLIGVGCLVFFGIRHVHGLARIWLFAMAAIVPLLGLLLHPRIFYGLMGRLLKRLKKPEITNRLEGAELAKLLVWALLGLLWQSVGVFLIVAQPLDLHWSKWYVVAGAYCLSWCAGFLAVWAPGGLGVREAVLIAALDFALPPTVRASFHNGPARIAFLTFLSALLRLWTIAGELIVTGIAYAIDYRGAIGRHLRPQQPPPPRELSVKV